MIKNEAIKKWCSEFEEKVFKADKIDTSSVHQLLEDYLRLKTQESNSRLLIQSIKNDLLKSSAGLAFFDNDIKHYSRQLDALFKAETEDLRVDNIFEAFQKNIIKAAWEDNGATTIDSVNPKSSSMLYDMGFADWEYVSQYFNDKIRGHYIQEAMAWIVNFIESKDYEIDDLVVKNTNGKIVKNKTFENIIDTINERALTNKQPFSTNRDGKYFYNSPKEPVKVKLWNDKEQIVYGATSTKNRDYKNVNKMINDWFYLASENAMIALIKEQREEKDALPASRVKDFLNMKIYNDIKKQHCKNDAYDSYNNHQLGDSVQNSLRIVRAAVKDDTPVETTPFSQADIESVKQLTNNTPVLLFYGSVLDKITSFKPILSGLFVKGVQKALENDNSIDFNHNESLLLNQMVFKFSGCHYSESNLKKAEELIRDFITLPKDSLDQIFKNFSEKNAYAEERRLLFHNLSDVFEKLNVNEGMNEQLKTLFPHLNDIDRKNMENALQDDDLFSDLKEKITNIQFSQHESSMMKNLFEEKLHNFWLKISPNRVGNYVHNKEKDSQKEQEKILNQVEQWVEDFVGQVILSNDSMSIKQVIIDEYFDLKNEHPNSNISGLVQSALVSNEALKEHYKDEKKVQKAVEELFDQEQEFECTEQTIKSLQKAPYIIKRRSEFLNKQDKITQWGNISRYFQNEESKSLIKEANGWLLGYLKKGDMNAYQFIKDNKMNNMNHLIDKINENATIQHPPFRISKDGSLKYNAAHAGELDVEFWNPETKKLYGMSITRHSGMEIEGNQFLRHAVKLFSKSLLLNEKGALKDTSTIQNASLNECDKDQYLEKDKISDEILKAIDNGDDFAKNLSIARTFLNKKYGINHHDDGFILGENEMRLMVNEMNNSIDFSFFGEIAPTAGFPEMNAGITNIGYIRNLKNIGNFELDSNSAEIFIDSIDKFYNGVDETKEVNDVAKRVLFNVITDNSMAGNIIEYFSEPNSQREEREAFIQSLMVFSDKIVENLNLSDVESLNIGVEAFFKQSIKQEEKEQLVDMLRNNQVWDNISQNLNQLETSPDEKVERYLLLEEQFKKIELLTYYSQNEFDLKNNHKKEFKKSI